MPIRLARPDDVRLLAAIETAAEQLFIDLGIELPPDSVTEPRAYEEACMERRLLLAADEADRPIGFSLLELVDRDVCLDELDAHPDRGRRGLGTALVRASCDWALAHGYRAITVTTWREVPWNGRFCRKLGFEELAVEQPRGGWRGCPSGRTSRSSAPRAHRRPGPRGSRGRSSPNRSLCRNTPSTATVCV